MQKVLLDQENRTQIKFDAYNTYIDFYVKKGKIWKFSLSYFWKLSKDWDTMIFFLDWTFGQIFFLVQYYIFYKIPIII